MFGIKKVARLAPQAEIGPSVNTRLQRRIREVKCHIDNARKRAAKDLAHDRAVSAVHVIALNPRLTAKQAVKMVDACFHTAGYVPQLLEENMEEPFFYELVD